MANSEEKPKKKKNWQVEEEEGLTRRQKTIIISIVTFVPFLLFIVLPMVTRDHYSKTLKLPPEVFLKTPEEINLVSTGDVGPVYKVVINDTEFKIPHSFTPTRIRRNRIDFKFSPRREARQLTILAETKERKLDFSATGIARWFMPSSMLQYLQTMLRATWHPIRLMFKANFFASEGITGRIFEARWDAHHRGFIFPVSGDQGYIGRIFRTNKPGYFEFMLIDSVAKVTLREWVNIAMKVKPPSDVASATLPSMHGSNSIDALIEKASNPDKESEILAVALTSFFRTHNPAWLIPVSLVMENRGYYAELIDLHKMFIEHIDSVSPYRAFWNEIFNRALHRIIKLVIDPQLNTRELNISCLNLTHLEITQVLLKVTVKSKVSGEKSFTTELLPHGRLYEQQEKNVIIRAPDSISLADAESLDYQILRLDFAL